MTDRIPVTSEMVFPLAKLVCPGGDCPALAEASHAEEYFGQELSFDRGDPKDGVIYLQANGQNILALREDETLTNLQYQSQYNFCPTMVQCNSLTDPDGKVVEKQCSTPPQKSCKNILKTVIVSLFGPEELKSGALSKEEMKRALKLRDEMGLGSSDNSDRSSEEMNDPPEHKSFLCDRWKGWNFGGEASFNFYAGPGGGSKLWLGYRQNRWDFRIAVEGEGVQPQKTDKEFRLTLGFEPIFHLLKYPLLFDPYLNMLGGGDYHHFSQDSWGIAFSPLGAGLQVHLNDRWSLYAGAKFVGMFPFKGQPKAGGEIPLGFTGHF